jgi:hypothetical protein
MTNTGCPLTLHAGDFLPVAAGNDQYLVAADRRQIGVALRHRPAAQVRHLEDRQLLLATPVVPENAPCAQLWLPGVEQGDAILAEQPGQVIATIGRHQSVVGLQPGRIALRLRMPGSEKSLTQISPPSKSA